MTSKLPRKRYPPAYEKIIPIALAFIATAVIILLIIIVLLVLGAFSGSS